MGYPMRVFSYSVPRGDIGTLIIVHQMRQLARGGMYAPSVRQLALDITVGIAGRDAGSQIYAIRNWLDTFVWFTRDPRSAELLYSPERMVKLLRDPVQGGILRIDCDDVAILAASLGGAVGLRSRFVLVGFLSPNAPYRHVWTELAAPDGIDSKWYDMDVTRGSQAINPAHISRKLAIEV